MQGSLQHSRVARVGVGCARHNQRAHTELGKAVTLADAAISDDTGEFQHARRSGGVGAEDCGIPLQVSRATHFETIAVGSGHRERRVSHGEVTDLDAVASASGNTVHVDDSRGIDPQIEAVGVLLAKNGRAVEAGTVGAQVECSAIQRDNAGGSARAAKTEGILDREIAAEDRGAAGEAVDPGIGVHRTLRGQGQGAGTEFDQRRGAGAVGEVAVEGGSGGSEDRQDTRTSTLVRNGAHRATEVADLQAGALQIEDGRIIQSQDARGRCSKGRTKAERAFLHGQCTFQTVRAREQQSARAEFGEVVGGDGTAHGRRAAGVAAFHIDEAFVWHRVARIAGKCCQRDVTKIEIVADGRRGGAAIDQDTAAIGAGGSTEAANAQSAAASDVAGDLHGEEIHRGVVGGGSGDADHVGDR